MRFPPNFADDLRNQADILRVASDYVTLKKRGANYLGLCPFHQEKTPSFNVHPGKQIFKCFGCGVSGDIYGFVMQIERCTFPEAVRIVAEKTGVKIPVMETTPQAEQAADDRLRFMQLNEWAAEFFRSHLGAGEGGRRALEYLRSRGVKSETIEKLGLGYSPASWDALSIYLQKKGAPQHVVEKSGLVSLRENQSGSYDRFRNRLMFPIRDAQGRVIAFGGRALGGDEPKYLNSPETALYTKGRHLFGLCDAKEEIRKRDSAVLVEGYMDFALPFQEGVCNVVASLGTALTEQQVRLLGRYTRNISVNFDPDSAGVAAAKRSIDLLVAEGFRVSVVLLPDGEDPDSFVLKHGAMKYREQIFGARPYFDFLLGEAARRIDATQPGGKARILAEIIPSILKIRNRVERAEYVTYAADRLKIEERLVREELRRTAAGSYEQVAASQEALSADISIAERQLLALTISDPEALHWLVIEARNEDFAGLVTEPVFQALCALCREGIEPTMGSLGQRLENDELLAKILPAVILLQEIESSEQTSAAARQKQVLNCLNAIRRKRVHQRLALVRNEIQSAERTPGAKDAEQKVRLNSLRREIMELNQTLQAIDALETSG